MKKTFGVNLYFFILVLLQVFGVYLLKPFAKLLHGKVALTLVITQIVFLLIPIIIYLIVTKQSLIKTLRLKKPELKNVLPVLGIALFFYPIAIFLGLVTDLFFHNNVQDVLNQMSSLPLWAFVLVIALTPAICEEMTVRGVILSGYNKLNIHFAAIMTGFMFGVLHMNPPQFLYTFALGTILAYVVRITGSIVYSMMCHFIFNGVNSCIAWYESRHAVKSADISTLSPVLRDAALIFYFAIAAFAVAITVVLIMYLKDKNKEKLQLEEEAKEKITTVQRIITFIPIALSVGIYIAFAL